MDAPAAPEPAALRQAASQLAAGLRAHDDPEYRRALLKRLAKRLGDEDYPLFLRLLCVVEESGDAAAGRLLADSFADALRRADLPGGGLNSWGATRLPDAGSGTITARQLSERFFASTPSRSLGPIEFLTVWLNQKTQRISLSEDRYRQTVAQLVSLFNRSDAARTLYAAKLAADAGNELEGAYTGATRERLAALAGAWQQGREPSAVAEAACPLREGAP